MRAADLVAPPELGRDFPWLWASTAVTNLADGVLLAAGPLLVTSITRQPSAVAASVVAQRLPWLLFGLLAGVLVDRVDRRALLLAVNTGRALVLLGLATVAAAGVESLPVILGLLFLIGTAETFADNADDTVIAVAVPKIGLGRANARLMGLRTVTNQLAGPPLGALLFGLGTIVPFGANAALFGLAVVLVSRLRLRDVREVAPDRVPLLAQVREGMAWLWHHDAVRTLALLITAFNITFGATFGILVLYAFEVLGLGDLGFGLLLSASAAGGVVGSFLFRHAETRFALATLLRIGLVIEVATHLGLALTSTPWVAGTILFVFGVHAVTWGTIATTVRHRAVPPALLGRVTSVYLLGSVGALAIGTAIGGLVADRFGVLGAIWFAFVGALLTTVVSWRSISAVADVGEPD